MRCGNACHGPHNGSLYTGSEHSQFNSIKFISLLGHIGPIQNNTHMNIDTRIKKSTRLFKGIHTKPGSCSTYKFNHHFNFIQNLELTTVVLLFWAMMTIKLHDCFPPQSDHFFQPVIYQHTFDSLTFCELQKWALRANKLIKRFSLDIQVAKNVLNLSTSWYLIWLVCTINGRRYRWVLYGKWKILRTALFHAVHINLKLELNRFQAWLP